VTSTPTTSSGATAPVDDAALDDAPVVAGELADEPHSGTTSSSGEQDGHEVDAASVTPARHLAPGPSEAETPAEPVPHRHRARHRRWILPAVLAVLLVGAIGSGVYLWRVAEAWIERDAQWQAHASDLAEELGTTKSELGDTMGELEVVRGQLDQAQARISELADEKARLGDEHAVVRQLADYQERVSQVAATVVSGLDACIASQQRLVGWYADAAAAEEAGEDGEPGDVPPPSPAVLESLSATVSEVCASAQEAKDALQDELDG